jgi:hypothetical protein
MSEDRVTTPRLLYKGPANEFADTCEVKDQAGLDKALKEGWRLKRVDAQHAHKPAPAPATVAIPAQTLQTSASAVPVEPVKAAKADPPAKKK